LLIAHTTDLSGNDDIAFEHAHALAKASGARLASVHACVGPAPERELPQADPGVDHQRVLHECCDDATDTLLDALTKLEPDLVVAATHARTGLERLLGGSVAEGVARNLPAPTLLLPLDGTRFVDEESGETKLARLLVPIATSADAEAGVNAAAMLVRLAGSAHAEIVTLHVGSDEFPPAPAAPPGITLTRRRTDGRLEDAIVDTANAIEADLVVMPTRGHDGVGDVLFGSHTERVLHRCKRPVLWVPLQRA
jgi:nucleotide-binding universal stress UspA family protein